MGAIALLAGCAENPDEKAVSALWDRSRAAILAGDGNALAVEAPFLSGLSRENRTAVVERLKTLAESGGKAKVTLISATSALISFPANESYSIPAERNRDGSWALSDVLSRRQTIDFVPASE